MREPITPQESLEITEDRERITKAIVETGQVIEPVKPLFVTMDTAVIAMKCEGVREPRDLNRFKNFPDKRKEITGGRVMIARGIVLGEPGDIRPLEHDDLNSSKEPDLSVLAKQIGNLNPEQAARLTRILGMSSVKQQIRF